MNAKGYRPAPVPVLGTLGYLLGGSGDWMTLQDIVGWWLVTLAGFAAGSLRDRIKQSPTEPPTKPRRMMSREELNDGSDWA